MRGKGTISFPPWNSFLENWSKKNPHSSSEPRKFSSRLLLSRRWAVAGNNVFRVERGTGRGEGRGESGWPASPPPRPPACRSTGRTFDNELHFPQRWLWSTWETRNVTGIDVTRKGTEASRHPSPPPPLAPRRSTMNLLHDRQSIRRGGGSGGFSPTESSSDERPIRRPRPDG